MENLKTLLNALAVQGAAYIIAQAIGPITTVLCIVSAQMKRMTPILVIELTSNLLVAVSYILLKGYSGSYICFTACIQVIISFIYLKKNKSFPKGLAIVFILCYVAISFITYREILDILPGICAVGFALSVIQKRASGYRFFMLIGTVLWIVYDILIGSYGMLLTHGVSLISLLVATVRQDLKSEAGSAQ